MTIDAIRTGADAYLRDYVVNGVPASTVNEPSKSAGRAVLNLIADELDSVANLATSGIRWSAQIVRVRSTANVVIASALENGDTLNGVTLATGDHVFLGSQTAPAENGLYTVVASGAASRATFADSAAELARIGFLVSEGTVGAGERYTLPLDTADITVGTTALTFARVGIDVDVSSEVAVARAAFDTIGDRIDDLDDRVDVAERVAAATARAALYGITDPTEAGLFAAQGVELDFVGGYYRAAYEAPADATDLTGWTFSRALAGTAENASGTLDSFATGVPRITNLGLLVEPARTNLIKHSQAFDNAAWTKYDDGVGVTPVVTADAAEAPDGTTTADRVVLSLGGGTTTSDWSMLFPTAGIAIASGQVYWGSVWVKGTAGEKIAWRHVAGAAYVVHTFSGSWERLASAETAASGTGDFQIGLRGGQATPVTNSVTFDIWGAQLELGNYPTSYIPTAADAVARPADAPALSGLNIGPCTVIVDFSFVGEGSATDVGARVVTALAGDSNADRALLFNTADGLRLAGEVVSVGTIECNAYGEAEAGAVQRVAFRLASDNSRIARNGSLGDPDNIGSPPIVFTRLGVGMYPWGASHAGVNIRRLVVIPLARNDSALLTNTGGDALPAAAQQWVQVKPAAAFSVRDSARSFRIGGRQYIANGFLDGGIPIKDLWSSTDGLNYELVNGAPPYEDWSTVIAVGSAIYAFRTEMWRSLDGGVTWTKIINTLSFAMETDSPALVHEGVLLAFPGTGLSPDAGNGVWSYNVGANTWTQIYTAGWGPRTIPTAASFNGDLYLYGGFDKTVANVPAEITYPSWTTLNDLWRSTDDGVTWTRIVTDMPFQPRVWPSMVVFEGEMYLMAGFDNLSDPQTNFADTYKTSDGETWSLVPVAGTYIERHAAATYVTNGRLFLASGKANLEPGDGVRNDIWELQTV